ncbi:MAG: GAF domain-containing protein, partial [Rhodospirillaceae bacterium]|nr:GAF domain-containing protein [Rhodospirillaceae bacterium]
MTRSATTAEHIEPEKSVISEQLSLLAELGRDFATSLDIEVTLERAVERITSYVDAEGGALFLLQNENTQLRCEASTGATDITGIELASDHGIVGRCVQTNTGEIVRDVSKDKSFDGSVDDQTGFTTKSILCAPLSVNEEKIGAIELINKRGESGLFDDSDLQLLEVLSSSAALAIVNARMAADLVEQEKMRRELELAAEIQRNLLPIAPDPNSPIFGVNIPARTVSGDFFDFFELEDGRIAFCLGDVSGKGMNAALLMAKTASL